MEQELDINTLIAFTRRDPQAFRIVFELLYPEVRYVIEKIIGNPEDAREITSDTFLKLFNKCEAIASLNHIRGFLFTTGRRKCLDFIRHRKRTQSREKKLHLEIEQLVNDSNFNNYLLEAGVIAKVYEAVEKLPAECKKIFKLLFYQGMEQTEVASLMAINVSTVRSQKCRALQLLRITLADDRLALLFFLSFSYVAYH